MKTYFGKSAQVKLNIFYISIGLIFWVTASTCNVSQMLWAVDNSGDPKANGESCTPKVAAVCGTDSLDGAEIYNDMIADPFKWNGIALYDNDHNKAKGTSTVCVDLGSRVDLLDISGHSYEDAKPTGVTGEEGYGLYKGGFRPSDIGARWNSGCLKWLILAACNQVEVSKQSPIEKMDNGIVWIMAMPNVHCLMGYRLPAPTGATAVTIAKAFCGNAQSDFVHMSWMLANRPSLTVCTNRNASCIVRTSSLEDKLSDESSFAIGKKVKTYRYYWIEMERNLFSPNEYRIKYYTITLP